MKKAPPFQERPRSFMIFRKRSDYSTTTRSV
jgi:hypothetical protein